MKASDGDVSSEEVYDFLIKSSNKPIDFNESLNKFLSENSKKKLEILIDFLSDPKYYQICLKVLLYVQSSDNSVFDIFANNPSLIEKLIIYFCNSKDYPSAAGLFSRIIGKTFGFYPDIVFDIMRNSSVIIPSLVEALGNSSILQCLCDEICITRYKGVPLLMFSLSKVMFNKYIEQLEPYVPLYMQYLDFKFNCDIELSPQQFCNISTILEVFTANFVKDGKIPFENGLKTSTVSNFLVHAIILTLNDISEDNFDSYKYKLLYVARNLPYSIEVHHLIENHVRDVIKHDKTCFENDMMYLAKHNKDVSKDFVIEVLKYLSVKEISNTIECNMILFLRASINSHLSDIQFISDIIEIIKRHWYNARRKKKVYFLTLVSEMTEENQNSFGDEFINSVLTPFLSKEPACPVNWNISPSVFL